MVTHHVSRITSLVSLFVCLSLLLSSIPANAQSKNGTALITAVETSSFPAMEVYLAVNNAEGQHLAGLTADAFSLTEDSAPISTLTASEQEVGVQVVFLLDTSSAFKTRDANGNSRLDFIKQALTDFAQTTPWMKDIDDVSVLTSEGVLLQHSRTGQAVAQALADYTTKFTGVADNFPLINQALDFASDSTPQPGMRRYLVLISGGLTRSGSDSPLADLVARAKAAQVQIQTVFVGAANQEAEPAAQKLLQLAQLTGGNYFLFEKPASLTPLFQHLADQRTQYQVSYRSTLAVTGQHSLSVTVHPTTGAALVSGASIFPLRLEPPSVTIHDVPARLTFDSASSPTDYAVPITVDFSDGHPRPLKAVQLLVDGKVVTTQPQPETLATVTWPLKDYRGSETHTLQVHVTDELGLAADSGTVEVTLEIASMPITQKIVSPLNLTLAAVIGLGIISAGGLVLIVRRRPPSPRRRRGGDTMPLNPVTPDTVPAAPMPRNAQTKPRPALRLAGPAFRFANPAAKAKSTGKAYFEVVEPGGGGTPRENIEIGKESLRLGRDPALAEVVFQDRSVSRRHARVVEESEGVFRIYDEGSTSGTWVNFTQVPQGQGQELQPGDVINLGRVQLRFKRRDAAASGNGAKVTKASD
jgi:pSer/pThr/pTyr-binding forkhead associated (FHA) protein